MFSKAFGTVLFLTLLGFGHLSPIPKLQDNIAVVLACSKVTHLYPSMEYFLAEVTGKKMIDASQYKQGELIGSNDHYTNVQPGDLVGTPGNYHYLSIYIGNQGCKCEFIDVPSADEGVRCLPTGRTGYGDLEFYKYYYPTE